MDFNLYPLKVFGEVVRARSLTRAAVELGISQPAVSAHIKALESKFGEQLLQRGVKETRLTPFGQEVHAQALVVLLELEELHSMVSGSSRRRAPIIGASTTPGAFWLPRRLAKFQRDHSILCDCQIADSHQVRSWVLERRVLFGLVGELPATDLQGLESKEIGRDSLQLMAPSGHPLLGRKDLTDLDFRQQTLLLRPSGSSTRTRAESMLSSVLGHFQRVVELNSGEAIKEAVLAGLGLAVLSTWSVQRELQERLIAPVDPNRWIQLRPIYLIRRAGRPLKGQAALLWDFLAESR
ncbi:LysR family transcriptional regulator [bacterium]|nr:LysR family transcriptional regulator [bacterium]